MPKFTIITATFNNADTIGCTIESVINQSFKDFEYIIIDGASTDSTGDIIQKNYSEHITAFISEPDQGMYHALNKGIKLAKGEIIGFIHSDDFYAGTDILTKVAAQFDANECEAVYGDLQYVYKNDSEKVLRYWKSGEYLVKNMRKGWMPPHPTLFIRKEMYDNFGGFDTHFKVAADYELMTRFLCVHKMRACYVPEVFIKMRWGGKSNKNIKNIVIKSLDDYRAIRKNRVGNFGTLILKNFSKIGQFLKRKDA